MEPKGSEYNARGLKKETKVNLNRKGFLASSAMFATASGVAAAQGVPGGTHLVERHADFDESVFSAAVGRPAQIRQLFEATVFRPAVLSSIRNSFNGLQFGFGYPADAISIVLAGHGPSAVFGYTDYLWSKYRIGEFLKLTDAQGNPVRRNVYLSAHAAFDSNADPDDDGGMYQDTSIATLQRRGLTVLTCHTAVEEQARAIVRDGFAPAGMTRADVAADVLTHLIAGAIVVPSMVATIGVLQAKYRYAYVATV
jgi:hypothetical protein